MRLINEQDVFDIIDDLRDRMTVEGYWSMVERVKALPSAQPDSKELSFTHKALDTISRQDAIRIVDGIDTWQAGWRGDAIESMKALPSAQPETHEEHTKTHSCDCISRAAAIYSFEFDDDGTPWNMSDIIYRLEQMPSAQSDRTCVNCGRTVNNGGWYADGRTRCPIEEHYALPKDGYCHLWEKRNVTDDDYPERRTDESD